MFLSQKLLILLNRKMSWILCWSLHERRVIKRWSIDCSFL